MRNIQDGTRFNRAHFKSGPALLSLSSFDSRLELRHKRLEIDRKRQLAVENNEMRAGIGIDCEEEFRSQFGENGTNGGEFLFEIR
jgi:hypothetical protein